MSLALSRLVLICNFLRRHISAIFVPISELAFTRNTLNFTSHIYFHLDDSAQWKQYQSVSQEMIKQISNLETVKRQEIPIKVCVIFYNKFLWRLWRKKQVLLQSFNTDAATRGVL